MCLCCSIQRHRPRLLALLYIVVRIYVRFLRKLYNSEKSFREFTGKKHFSWVFFKFDLSCPWHFIQWSIYRSAFEVNMMFDIVAIVFMVFIAALAVKFCYIVYISFGQCTFFTCRREENFGGSIAKHIHLSKLCVCIVNNRS